MKHVEIYTSPFCGYCRAAKRLLDAKGISFSEIDVALEPSRRDEMTTRAGGRLTVPQIFVDTAYLGDCDALYALDRQGQLDPLLAA